MKLTPLAATAALLLCGSAAQATDLGPLDLSSGSAGFSNTPSIGAFVDTATFTLTGTSLANGSLTAVVNGGQDVDFSSITITGPGGNFAFSQLNPDPVEVWALPAAGITLTGGTYTLTVTGTNSVGGGSYGGNLAVTGVVPEPETLALLLAGIGALAAYGARRKR